MSRLSRIVFSLHARSRAEERGVGREEILLILAIGTKQKRYPNRQVSCIDPVAVERARISYGLDCGHLVDFVVILDTKTGVIVTVFRKQEGK